MSDFKKLYLHNAQYAIEHNEIAEYRESLKTNIQCANAISVAIAALYNNNRLDSEKAINSILPTYGFDRIKFVVAETIKSSSWDGRYSMQSKVWASSVPTVDDTNSYRYQINAHPGLIDLFASQLQNIIKHTQLEISVQQLSENYPSNPHVIAFEIIEIFGHKALFANCKLELSNLPKNVFCYELREDGKGNLNTLEPYVRNNFAGSVITSEQIPLTSADGLEKKISNDDISYVGEYITLSEHLKKSGKTYTLETNAGYEIIEHFNISEKTSFVIGYRKKTLDCDPFVVWRKNDRGYDGGYYCNSYDEAKKNQIERIQRARNIESPTFSI